MKFIPEMKVRDCYECPYHYWKVDAELSDICNYGYIKPIPDPHNIPDWCKLDEVE